MNAINIPVQCMTCGNRAVLRHTAQERKCSCGSTDIDIYEPNTHSAAIVQTPVHQPPQTIPGWSEYQGPMPGRNDQSNGVPDKTVCPVCHGSGYASADGYGGTCRECAGSGYLTPNTAAAPPLVARHDYPSLQTKVPFMGSPGVETTPPVIADSAQLERDRMRLGKTEDSLVLTGAKCPCCEQHKLALRQDANDDAITTCANCGPLVNLDRKPQLDPWSFPENFTPERAGRMRQAFRKLVSGGTEGRTGRLYAIAKTIDENNDGLHAREVIAIARETVTRY